MNDGAHQVRHSGAELVQPQVQQSETEREEDASQQQQQQAGDAATRLQDELREARDRERQLQQQLDKMKLEMIHQDSEMTLFPSDTL